MVNIKKRSTTVAVYKGGGEIDPKKKSSNTTPTITIIEGNKYISKRDVADRTDYDQVRSLGRRGSTIVKEEAKPGVNREAYLRARGVKKMSDGGSILAGATAGASMGAVAGPWGMAAGAVIGGVTSAIKSNKEKKKLKAQQKEVDKTLMDQSILEQDVYAKQFRDENITDLPTYKKGGKLNTTDTSTTGEFDTVGGDLIPISDNAEIVKGNTHKENNIDGSYGVTLSKNGNPVANIEDEEVIVDNNLVFSNKLKLNGQTYADIALDVNNKIGELQVKAKNVTKPAQKFSIERTIKGLELANQNLFNRQELTKQNLVGGEENDTVAVENGVVPKGANGLDLSKKSRNSLYADAEDTTLGGDNDSTIGIIGKLAPLLVDNIANFMMTKNAPKVVKPSIRRSAIIDTAVNASPQLADVTNAVGTSNEVIRGNTNNSSTARANITANNLKGAKMRADIYAAKDDQERNLKNQQAQLLVNTANTNAELFDGYQEDVRNRTLEQNKGYSDNIANLQSDVNAVKQVNLQKDVDEEIITLSLLDDPTGEKARTFKRIGKTLSPERKMLLLKELQRTQQLTPII